MICVTKQISQILKLLENETFSTRIAFWEKPNPSPINGKNIWLSGVEVCAFGKKKNATFTENCKSAVWKETSVRGKIHPTQKPISLFERLILASSNKGDLVLDCFAGSGTTAIACENTNRKWVCIEQDETYANKAVERIINHVVPKVVPTDIVIENVPLPE
jgi:DNA modification methylase